MPKGNLFYFCIPATKWEERYPMKLFFVKFLSRFSTCLGKVSKLLASLTLMLDPLLIRITHTSHGGKKQATESLKQREVVLLSSLFPIYNSSFDLI